MEELTVARLCDEVRSGQVIWSRHFTQRTFERDQPTANDVRFMLCEDEPWIMERYTERPGILIWATVESGRCGHVHCGYPPNAVIVTAYWPDTEPDEWLDDYRVRRR